MMPSPTTTRPRPLSPNVQIYRPQLTSVLSILNRITGTGGADRFYAAYLEYQSDASGPYTFLLKASRETPRRLKHERRGTIGLRVPDHPVTAMLLGELGEPVMSSTLLLPGEELARTDAKEIYDKLEHSVDLVLDGGNCGLIPTTVIDLSGNHPVVVRVGRGSLSPFGTSAPV